MDILFALGLLFTGFGVGLVFGIEIGEGRAGAQKGASDD